MQIPAVSTADLLKKSQLDTLHFEHYADQKLWDLVHAEIVTLRARGVAAPFVYVDLTMKELNPLWMSPEEIGGKLNLNEGMALDPSAQTSDLAGLSRALKAATEAPRFFRTVSQWKACFLKYASLAVALEQMSWPVVLMHMGIINQLVERERSANRGPFAAFLYDDMLRKRVATRVARHESLVLTDVFAHVDKTLYETVQQRLAGVLHAAGIKSTSTPAGPSGSGGGNYAQYAADGGSQRALEAQMDKAKQATERADRAATALASQQRDILSKAKATGKGKAGKGSGKREQEEKNEPYWDGRNAKDRKAAKWKDKQDQRRGEQTWKKRRGDDW